MTFVGVSACDGVGWSVYLAACCDRRVKTVRSRPLVRLLCQRIIIPILNIKTYQYTLLCKSDQVTHPKQRKSFY